MNSEFSEMLKQVVGVNDLRKKETLRLIECGKMILQEVANVASRGISGKAKLKDVAPSGEKIGEYIITAEPGCDEQGKKVGVIKIKKIIEYSYGNEVVEEKVIAYSSNPPAISKSRIPGENSYGIPQDYRLRAHIHGHENNDSLEEIAVNYYNGGKAIIVPGKWFFSLSQYHLMEPESIPRSLWILVVRAIQPLIESMVENEKSKLKETQEASLLAERIVNAGTIIFDID